MGKRLDVYYENDESEKMSISDIFYLIRNYRLVSIDLDNGYSIKQWKDLPMVIEREGETFDMKYGKVYCCSGDMIESVWDGRGEEDLEQYINTCSNYI